MQETAGDDWTGRTDLPVSIIVSAPPGEARQDHRHWRIMGVVAGQRFAADGVERVVMRTSPEGDLYMWRGHRIRLAPSEAEDYALNLAADVPLVYVVVRWDDEQGLLPLEVTVSLGEAQQMDSTELRSVDESVLTTPMPPEVGVWLQEFTVRHYEPRKKKKRGKRRSTAIYDAEVGDWAGDET